MKLSSLLNSARKFCLLSALSTVALVSCRDNELDYNESDILAPSRGFEVTNPGGLIQQSDGTWLSKNCRVPIVGPGRLVNELHTAVSLINVGQGPLQNIVDTDLTNSCSVPVGVKAGVGVTPIVSVKDMYHIYSPGQKVGFVYKDTQEGGASLLSLDLLKGLTLTTYLNGELQETVNSNGGGNTLKLDLLAFNQNGGTVADRELAFEATKKFDEVRMSFTGVNATALSNLALAIKYAFVGDTPEIRATSEQYFVNYWTGGSPSVSDDNVAYEKNLVDADTTNYAPFTSQLGIRSSATIDFHRTIPAGTEIGFCFKTGKLLGINLLGQDAPTLTTYGDDNKEIEKSSPKGSLLSLSLIGVTGKNITNIITQKECSKIRFQHPAELVDLGGMNVYYAYVRPGVELDPVNYFTLADDVTYNFSYKLPQPLEGTVQYQVVSYPYGNDKPEIKDGKLIGMIKDGAYRVQALFNAPNEKQVLYNATITHRSVNAQSECTNYITAKSHGAYATNAIGDQGCLLCIFNGNNNLNNVVDNDPTNYATAGQVAGVLEWYPLAAFKMNRPISTNGEKNRTGFIIQANSNLLDLSALSLFEIRLYDGEKLVSATTTDDKKSVNLGLLGFDKSKMCLSVETDQTFDRIELWRKGIADVLTSIRIYNIFQEPVSCKQAAGEDQCMEMLTATKDNLQIDYPHTIFGAGVADVAGSLTGLENILDGNTETGAKMGSILSLSGTTLGLKFNKQTKNQVVGILFKGLGGLADVTLANVGVLRAYNGDNTKELASSANVDILGVSAIIEGGYTYIEVMVPAEFDRITFTTGGVGLLDSTQICGVYIRPDSDGDGIPDCADDDNDNDGSFETDGEDFHTCYGNPLEIPVKTVGSIKEVYVYAYDIRKQENIACKSTLQGDRLIIPAKALPTGEYELNIYSEDKFLCGAGEVTATIHPTSSTWRTNAKSTDWNDWDNWTEGSPWYCTNVVIPSNATIYPELKADEKNNCKNIHFESGAEVVGLSHLNIYGKSFVDLTLQGGSYYLLSAPLKEMVTGDMFISPSVMWGKDKYFTVLTAENYKESRNRPIVYQHFWNSTAIEEQKQNSSDVGTAATWSQDFNSVNTRYELGQGFLLRAGASSDRNGYTFHFPKNHTEYSYFNSNGEFTGKKGSVARGAEIGKLALTGAKTVTLKNKTAGKTFLLGNPYMTHINVAELMKGNPAIKEVRVCRTRTYNPNAPIEGQTVSSRDNASLLVAPMEACFIVVENDATEFKVNLTEGMLMQKRSQSKN